MEPDIPWNDGPGRNLNANARDFQLAMLNDIEFDDDEETNVVANYFIDFDDSGNEETTPNETEISSVSEEFKDDETLVPGGLASPVVRSLFRFIANRTMSHNRQLLVEYFAALTAFFGEDHVPPNISFAFEIILEIGKRGPSGEVPIKNNTSAEVVTINLWKSSWLESKSTKQLRKLLVVTLEMLNIVVDVTARLKEKMESEGSLNVTTTEHTLCVASCYIMCRLLNRLQVLHTRLQTRVSTSSGAYEQIILGTKFRSDYWVNLVQEIAHKDIAFSVATKVEGLYIKAYEYMLVVTAGLCWQLQITLLKNSKISKLDKLVSDLMISVRDARDGLRSGLDIYDFIPPTEVTDLPHRLSFSRENKILRQCHQICIWNDRFMAHTDSARHTCALLRDLREYGNWDADKYQKLMEELKKSVQVSFKYSQQLHALLNTQSALIKDLCDRGTPDPHGLPEVEPVTSSIRVPPVPQEPEGEQSTEQHLQPSEFGNCDGVDPVSTRDLNDMASADEVFVGLFSNTPGEDDAAQEEPEYSTQEQVLVQQLYSGVVTQLKSALVPVKSKMKVREKEAVTKLYGIAPLIDDKEDEEDNESVTEQEIQPLSLDSTGDADNHVDLRQETPKTHKSSKRRTFDDVEDDTDSAPISSPFLDADFMKELQVKLNKTPAPNICFVSEGDNGGDEELICEPSSEEEDKGSSAQD